MTLYSRINTQTNKCEEFINFDPHGRFEPSIKWVEVPIKMSNYVDYHYMVDDKDIIIPPSIEYLQKQLKERLKEFRYIREVSGITVNGLEINTDRISRNAINDTYQLLSTGTKSSVDWKTPNGWVSLDLTEFESIMQEVSLHVQKCFSAERNVVDKIDSIDNIDDLLDINLDNELDYEYNK